MSKIFGKLPTGDRLRRVKASPNYKDGKFVNLSVTPDLADDATMWKVLKAFRNKPSTARPSGRLPAHRPQFGELPEGAPGLIWLGHSSYYLLFEGLKILVDPVLGGRASPVPGMVKAFDGTDVVQIEDIPELDYVLITHDHYDHLDYQTVKDLRSRARHWVCSLGVGAHLEYWGIPAERITELDWWEGAKLDGGCTITAAPARHFSGRALRRAQSLWSSFVLKSEAHSFFLGGDSGWDAHFEEIGARYGPFDLAILECGQYHPYWKHIHMMPEEVILAARALGAQRLLPVHWGKFSLALHPWDEPIERLLAAAAGAPVEVLTPMIGEAVRPLSGLRYDTEWWKTERATTY